mmetsp:Transcript_27574/g.95355  ORF Transcript_27574/g.95355 Transcript_27574/m.95355 type:complete len:229 (-) Transcript_27574:78-764(-)
MARARGALRSGAVRGFHSRLAHPRRAQVSKERRLAREQEVLGLDVAVRDAGVVQGSEGEAGGRDVLRSCILPQTPAGKYMIEQVALGNRHRHADAAAVNLYPSRWHNVRVRDAGRQCDLKRAVPRRRVHDLESYRAPVAGLGGVDLAEAPSAQVAHQPERPKHPVVSTDRARVDRESHRARRYGYAAGRIAVPHAESSSRLASCEWAQSTAPRRPSALRARDRCCRGV